MSVACASARAPDSVSFWQAFGYWLRLGFISFGGPSGQIAIMHHDLVEKRRWISEKRFLHALNYCMLLPGPEAQQLATCLVGSVRASFPQHSTAAMRMARARSRSELR